MERAVEPERKWIQHDPDTETEEETEMTSPEQVTVDKVSKNVRLGAQIVLGIATMIGLVFVPLVTLPGMYILVLAAEVYLLDWTYSKVSQLRDAESFISKETAEISPEDEIDRKVARTSPKDQFVK